jgi:hypothetical protein
MVDKETQIKVLHCGDPLRFACEILGVKETSNQKYDKGEIYKYISINGIPVLEGGAL